ncbi:TPA: hypothetical protein QDA93_002529 [Burkholderia vietnamiensis]|nr:hypothetical protein [Burkholderia vietnamiensis]
MLNPDDWKAKVVESMQTTCPVCESSNVTMGACAIGSMTVHQEYICESCNFEFTALFALIGFYKGHPSQ